MSDLKAFEQFLDNKVFMTAKLEKQRLESACEVYSKKPQSYPKNEFGLTLDEVKNTSEWKLAKKAFDMSFRQLREFNAQYVKQFRKELRK